MADREEQHAPDPDPGSRPPEGSPAGPADPHAPSQDELAALRSLLLGADWGRVQQILGLLETPESHAAEVSKVIAEALAIRSARDDAVSNALSPTIDIALKESIDRNPQGIVDAIFPVIGPAIRRAVADALQRTTQVINTTLEHSLTLRSVRWRFEAMRTGRSFAEVVLSHTLLYRVEQVFLIHREGGLLLDHVSSSGVGSSGADMVSGMLTAIQEFVRDSFGVADGETLRTLTVGGLTIWIEQGPHALVAAVVRGRAPVELRARLQDALGAIHLEQRDALREFNGDAAPFARSRHRLEACLVQEAATPVRTRPSIGTSIIILIVIVLLGTWLFVALRTGARWRGYLDSIEQTPGLVITEHHRGFWKMRVTGLRDDLAEDPASMVEAHRLAPERIAGRWHRFRSLDQRIVERRADVLLGPPPSVELALSQSGVLRATGSADGAWARAARAIGPTIGGVSAYDDSAVRIIDLDTLILENAMRLLRPPDTVTLAVRDRRLRASGPAPVGWIEHAAGVAPSIEFVVSYDGDELIDEREVAFGQTVDRVQSTRIQFTSGIVLARGAEELSLRVASDLATLARLAEALERSLVVHIVGHADPSGSSEQNMAVSERRASFVADELVRRGIHRTLLSPIGVGATEPPPDAESATSPILGRRVSFVIEHVGSFGP